MMSGPTFARRPSFGKNIGMTGGNTFATKNNEISSIVRQGAKKSSAAAMNAELILGGGSKFT